MVLSRASGSSPPFHSKGALLFNKNRFGFLVVAAEICPKESAG